MKTHEIEAWALREIERVERHQPTEDSRVELKAEWIDPDKAARRIAGHANALRGEPILWLIGVDQTRGVVGALPNELANWWPQVNAQFDGLAPELKELLVSWKSQTVVALFFRTDRIPYIVKNPVFGKTDGGPVAREVPWREGTATRSATHSDLILLLSPLQRLPKFDFRLGILRVTRNDGGGGQFTGWDLQVTLYVVPKDSTRIVVPYHQCEVFVRAEGWKERTRFVVKRGVSHSTETITATDSEYVITGPGMLRLHADHSTRKLIDRAGQIPADIEITLLPVDLGVPAKLTHSLPFNPGYVNGTTVGAWALEFE